MDLNELLNSNIKLHRRHNGEEVTYGACNQVLEFIYEHVNNSSNTLETGAGISTIIFSMKQTQHISIVPDEALVKRITQFCVDKNFSVNKIKFYIEPSETLLPRLSCEPLDLVFIDGQHAFPSPFIDWYYTESKLKIGGILIIDDIQLWTGAVLKDFLNKEKGWKLKERFGNRAVVFTKIKEGSSKKWWGQQPFVVAHSDLRTQLAIFTKLFKLK